MSTQGDNLKAIADAIRAKEGSSDPIIANDFPARIAAIETGTQLPTLTNPGTAADMAQGKQLIGQDGEIIEGNLLERTSGETFRFKADSVTSSSSNLGSYWINWTQKNDEIIRSGALCQSPIISLSTFGNATAADVAAGKTFTSEAGVMVTGTAAPDSSYLKGFTANFTGNGGNNVWITYPGQMVPTGIFIALIDAISTGNNLFTLVALAQMGAYTTSNFRSVLEEVSYGTEKTGVLSLVQSGNQLRIVLPSNTYFQSGGQYIAGGFYTT